MYIANVYCLKGQMHVLFKLLLYIHHCNPSFANDMQKMHICILISVLGLYINNSYLHVVVNVDV